MKLFKKLALLFSVLFLFSSFNIDSDKSYVGKWKGKDKGDIGFITLSSDNYATFEFEGRVMGGKSYMQQGLNAAMTYTVDESTKPYKIDFIMINKENNSELGRLLGIINMITPDEMEMAIGFDGSSRPSDFSSNNITFYRHKE
ncbi:hypothetical protein DFQ05_0157 [Winogradskyella wandonensis]|uniref:Uncharacterized protein n=1 Tax=Winogradskyella wandonensis TaxID=1442586 RepID=A0A4R1KW64_9FLAO|nr:hypothetical protein [Winogradskyella wandonensis]TCK68649.1 hypothetical protein DFQ05_0157 [Winogradskyella wandonensis]